MSYYSLSTWMNAGIWENHINAMPADTLRFKDLVGNGHQFGAELSYVVQSSPDELAQAF